VYRRREISRLHVTRLRLRRGWGRFKAEEVTVVVGPESEQTDVSSVVDLTEVRSAIDLVEILDLDDEDAETGLPDGRERPN
jgi:hypothetical protein